MKLRDKEGRCVFHVRDPATGREWEVQPKDYLTRRQLRKMINRPQMIVAFAHHLEELWREREGVDDAEVRVLSIVSLNGRKPQLMIDPTRDLTRVDWGLAPADWIVPLTEPLPARAGPG
jgi:hypothetical protein